MKIKLIGLALRPVARISTWRLLETIGGIRDAGSLDGSVVVINAYYIIVRIQRS